MFRDVECMQHRERHCRDEERGNDCGEDLVRPPMTSRRGLVVSDLFSDPIVGEMAFEFLQLATGERFRSGDPWPSVPDLLERAHQPVLRSLSDVDGLESRLSAEVDPCRREV